MRRENGLRFFYQYELNQRLLVEEDCTLVHFGNGTMSKALSCEVLEENDARYVQVPNILLETVADIHAYAWNEESTSVMAHVVFSVEAREKPADYAYTETEVKRYDVLLAMLEEKGAYYTPTVDAEGNLSWKKSLEQMPDAPAVNIRGPQGEPGARGYTPERGVDYWTAKDKQDMKTYAEEVVREILGYVPIKITSWKGVQNYIRQGVAAQAFKIGDQLVCNHATYGALVWSVIGFDCDTPVDEAYTRCLTLQLHDCLPVSLEFDAAEPNNPNTHRSLYGNNNWLQAAIRQWLNSDAEGGKWWSAQTEHDVAPSYVNDDGFLKGLDADFLSVVGQVKKITALNTVTDGGGFVETIERFFQPSLTEVNGGATGTINEGKVYPYYSSFSDFAGISYSTNRIKYKNGTQTAWGLRSPAFDYSCNVRGVLASGNVTAYNAKLPLGVSPCCCIY